MIAETVAIEEIAACVYSLDEKTAFSAWQIPPRSEGEVTLLIVGHEQDEVRIFDVIYDHHGSEPFVLISVPLVVEPESYRSWRWRELGFEEDATEEESF